MTGTDVASVQYAAFNLSGAAQQVVSRTGGISAVSINTVGTVVLLYDSATTSGVGASNLLLTVNAASLGVQQMEVPFQTGLVVATTGGAVCTVIYV